MSDHTLDDSPIFRVHIPDDEGLHWRSLISNLETGGVLERIVPDYEAGRKVIRTWFDGAFAGDHVVSDNIVDAALGNGDTIKSELGDDTLGAAYGGNL